MSKDKANHEEMKSIHSEAKHAVEVLEALRSTVKLKVRLQGTATWLTQKIGDALAHVEQILSSLEGIDKTLVEPPAIAAAAADPKK